MIRSPSEPSDGNHNHFKDEAVIRQGGNSVSISRNQHTIAESCKVSGRGYWTGREVCVVMFPAPVGSGVKLIRKDLPGAPSCDVGVDHRHDAQMRTIIADGPARFEMIEHLMAALYALEIDNCVVEIDGEELPGLDGSSKAYVDVLQHAGLIVQAMPRQRLVIDQTVRIAAANGWVQANPPRGDNFNGCSFEYQLQFDDEGPIKSQTYRFNCTPSSFIRDVASARTFVTQSQADSIRAQGIASHVTSQDLLVFGEDGPIDNKLRFDNECARHKTLDMIGDLALIGFDLVGSIVSYRGGHNLNGKMASALIKLAVSQSSGTQSNNREAA